MIRVENNFITMHLKRFYIGKWCISFGACPSRNLRLPRQTCSSLSPAQHVLGGSCTPYVLQFPFLSPTSLPIPVDCHGRCGFQISDGFPAPSQSLAAAQWSTFSIFSTSGGSYAPPPPLHHEGLAAPCVSTCIPHLLVGCTTSPRPLTHKLLRHRVVLRRAPHFTWGGLDLVAPACRGRRRRLQQGAWEGPTHCGGWRHRLSCVCVWRQKVVPRRSSYRSRSH
jgi:hypothetical protein